MEIQAIWSQPIQMKKDPKKVSIFILDADSLPETPGVYVFGRKHGKKIIPIYIGETLSIRGRVKNHLRQR
jgi:excinuclease UvrABC nuclease subunit